MTTKWGYIKLLIKLLLNKPVDLIPCAYCERLVDPVPYCSENCAESARVLKYIKKKNPRVVTGKF